MSIRLAKVGYDGYRIQMKSLCLENSIPSWEELSEQEQESYARFASRVECETVLRLYEEGRLTDTKI